MLIKYFIAGLVAGTLCVLPIVFSPSFSLAKNSASPGLMPTDHKDIDTLKKITSLEKTNIEHQALLVLEKVDFISEDERANENMLESEDLVAGDVLAEHNSGQVLPFDITGYSMLEERMASLSHEQNESFNNEQLSQFARELKQELDSNGINRLITLLDQEPSEQLKVLIRQTIAESGSAVAQSLALQLTSSDQQSDKLHGLSMLRVGEMGSDEAREVALSHLYDSDDINLKRASLFALVSAKDRPQEKAHITSVLLEHVQHEQAGVRGAAIEMLGQWGGDESSKEHIQLALTDESTQVRASAVFAANRAGLRSEATRHALLSMLQNDNESWETRMLAYSALSAHSMNAQEQEIYHQFQLAHTDF